MDLEKKKQGLWTLCQKIKWEKWENQRYPLTDGIVLPGEDSLGEGCILVIRVDIGSRTAARRSLTPAPVPVRVVIRRVVRVRLAVRIVAAKWDKRTYQIRRGTTTTRSVHQKVWLFS